MIYLASPYTDPDPKVREVRFHQAAVAAGRMMREGQTVFSPIVHCHPIALLVGLPTDWNFWRTYCELFAGKCRKLVVLKLDGWEASVGVQKEVAIAKRLGIPVEYIDL